MSLLGASKLTLLLLPVLFTGEWVISAHFPCFAIARDRTVSRSAARCCVMPRSLVRSRAGTYSLYAPLGIRGDRDSP
jgi:hypothetical protein